MPQDWSRHFVLDVESDGPHPLDYNMISFGLVNLEDPSLTFLGELAPLHMNDGGIPAARAVSAVSWEEQLKFEHPKTVMEMASCSIRTDYKPETLVAEIAIGLDRVITLAN